MLGIWTEYYYIFGKINNYDILKEIKQYILNYNKVLIRSFDGKHIVKQVWQFTHQSPTPSFDH